MKTNHRECELLPHVLPTIAVSYYYITSVYLQQECTLSHGCAAIAAREASCIRLSDSTPCMTLCPASIQVPCMALCQCFVCQVVRVAVVQYEDTLHRIA